MEDDIYYKVLDQKVAHEIIDGEAIVIHFDSGNYYSMTGTSSRLWQSLASNASRRQILDGFDPLTPEQIQCLDVFLDSLVKEGILEKRVGIEHASSPLPPEPRIPFETPKFVKYNDMQNLLLSDPIHDVDATGWPNLEPDNA